MDTERFFKDVSCICPNSDTGGGCQISTKPTHSLYYEDSSFGSRCRLLDFVTALWIQVILVIYSIFYIWWIVCLYICSDLHSSVDSCVSSNTEVCPWYIVTYSGRNHTHDNAELIITSPCLYQLENSLICLWGLETDCTGW